MTPRALDDLHPIIREAALFTRISGEKTVERFLIEHGVVKGLV